MVKKAIISLSDKTGIIEFAKGLRELEIEIISTGGTYKILKENNISVKTVEEVTKFPEILDGRVKTLHPLIHGGILADRNKNTHINELTKHNIESLDLVVVNLYPFSQVIKKENCTLDEAIENIDIGGVTLIRAAAKNYKYVSIVVDFNDYSEILGELKKGNKTISENTNLKLAKKAFDSIYEYDKAISEYFNKL